MRLHIDDPATFAGLSSVCRCVPALRHYKLIKKKRYKSNAQKKKSNDKSTTTINC